MDTNANHASEEEVAEDFCRRLSEELGKLTDEDGTITLEDAKTGEETVIPLGQFVAMFGLDDIRVQKDPPSDIGHA